MVVPSHPSLPADKVSLRRLARQRRREFVESLVGDQREQLENRLADALEPLLANSRITGGYCPMPNEISPLPAMDAAGRRGTILAYPAFADHQSQFKFLAGEPAEPGEEGDFEDRLEQQHPVAGHGTLRRFVRLTAVGRNFYYRQAGHSSG